MAEAAVEILKLSIDLLFQSPGFDYLGVRHQVSKIKLELDSMRSFLKDAERCSDGNEGLRCWVTQVRDAALNAEDVLDEFLYNLYRVERGGFIGFLRRAVSFPREIWRRHQTVALLKEIKNEIKEIAERRSRYDLSCHIEEDHTSHHSLNYAQNIGETAFFVEPTEVVGVEDESSQLLEWLMEGEKQRSVISIVGMGGSGKTTLAARAYNSQAVKRTFECFAWVSISQNYMIDDLLRKIINEFSSARLDFPHAASTTTNYKQLVETLVHFLQDKRYLIVLDDVWSIFLWKQVSVALPDHHNGNRVIITTRKEDIAFYSYGAGSHVLHSNPLPEDKAWTLFCNKAFCNEAGGSCPPELKDVARALVMKCKGLPLAILALGGLMASKNRSELKWKEVCDSLSWHISNNPALDEVKMILLLSFKDLPHFLKNCFLYFCCFPIEHWVGAGRLIRIWMAEGFLEEKKGRSQEDVGKDYLRELVSRNLLQVEKHNSFLRSKLCKLHDLMWELAHDMSDREHFVSVCNPQDLENEVRARRLSFHAVESTLRPGHNMRNVRSFSVFNVKDQYALPLDNLLLNFRLLRTLELMDAPIDNLPRTLGKLFNLRYLGLKGTKITELPTTIGRLRNLLTLDIRKTLVKVLPREIGKLRNLRHLLIYAGSDEEGFFYYIKGIKGPNSIVKLKHLRVLNCLEANSDIVRGIRELTQLRRLQLTNLKEEDGRDLCASIEKMKDLHHLLLMAENENEYLQVDQLSTVPSNIRKLTLGGRLRDVPGWFCSLRNVIHLHLHWSQLSSDPIPCISELPVLERLTLINAYSRDKRQLCFNGGFSRLEDLYLGNFPEVAEIIISEGTMPSLVRMTLHDCAKLKRVPQGIEHLRSLHRLNLKNASEELLGSIRGEKSSDYSRVQRIPSVIRDAPS
ncbi:Disease resistance protein RPM1 [Sesamum angolense]|uniref:Disease resistance protein RPM1 n=1 Tax=Sesamum angolense TaxID=2727404 RepID=A0AAE1W9B1_9LAMI|nr:Disease resistance protein RPM1 [Sesamum angolense]